MDFAKFLRTPIFTEHLDGYFFLVVIAILLTHKLNLDEDPNSQANKKITLFKKIYLFKPLR